MFTDEGFSDRHAALHGEHFKEARVSIIERLSDHVQIRVDSKFAEGRQCN